MRRVLIRRAGTVFLAFVMMVSFMPMCGEAFVFAAGGDKAYVEKVVELPDSEVKANKEAALAQVKEELGVIEGDEVEFSMAEATGETAGEAKAAEPAVETAPASHPITVADKWVSMTDPYKTKAGLVAANSDPKSEDTPSFEAQEVPGAVYVSAPDELGNVEVQGTDISGTGYRYEEILIGDEAGDPYSAYMVAELNGEEQYGFSKTVDMKQFTVGYHSVYVIVSDDSDSWYLDAKYVPTLIYGSVPNQLSNYYTGIHNFTAGYSDSRYYEAGSGEYLDVFMDFKKKSQSNWSEDVYLLEDSYTGARVTGLSANTTYQSRMMYGKFFTYNGENFLFTGRQNGYVSEVKEFKTAYTKPKVKSIKISKAKHIVHKYRVHYANRYYYRVYRNGTRKLIKVVPLYHTYKYHYTRFKVTVKFRKKQGVAGIGIRTIHGLNVWKNGDKKKYAQTFTCSGNKKGKKISVSVQSARSKVYGGLSGKYKKKVRVKR